MKRGVSDLSVRCGLVLIGVVLALGACSSDSDPASSNDAGVDGALADVGPERPPDECEAYGNRGACCADPACGWQEGLFSPGYDLKNCINVNRVCEVNGQVVRECPDGMICLGTGGWITEDDCDELPPPGRVNLAGRGICVWPVE